MIEWLKGLLTPVQKPLQWTVVEIEKPVPVLDNSDAEALASLKNHPGMDALLNRLRLQRAVLERQLLTTPHKDLNAVYLLQHSALGFRFAESAIRSATQSVEAKRTREAYPEEVAEFEKVLRSIESIGTTSPEK